MSRTTSPVTHTAETEVNSASEKLALSRLAVAMGSVNNMLPSRITSRKPRMIT